MDVARINFSHGDLAAHERNIANIRKVAGELNRVVAVLQDLQGPRLRIGDLKIPEVPLTAGEVVALTTNPTPTAPQEVPVQGADLSKDVRPGNRILI
jgi:pyruvate kinase